MTGSPFRSSRIVVLLLLAATAGIGFWLFGDELTLSKLANREAAFRQYQTNHPDMNYLVAFGIYVTITGLSLPGGTQMKVLITGRSIWRREPVR